MRIVRAWRALALAGLAALAMPAAASIIIYQQPTTWAGNGTPTGTIWVSNVDTTLTGFRAYDDFSLAAAAGITQVTWWGVYLDGNLADATPNTTDWIVRFQADNAGVPGAVLSSSTILDANVARVAVGTGVTNFQSTVTIYRLTASIPSFPAAAATTYWFTPLARSPSNSAFFGWIQGTGGNGASYQTQSAVVNGQVTVIGSFPRDGDRAFALVVPEPSVMALLLAALAAAAATLRPRARRA